MNKLFEFIRESKIAKRTLAVVIVWSLLVAGVLTFSVWLQHQNFEARVKAEVRTSADKDLLFRHWATNHGGVYVPVTETTLPNEYLTYIPERDITTASGRHLTLINPAYMMRQVQGLAAERHGVFGRMVSLQPINPVNIADQWESEQLTLLASKINLNSNGVQGVYDRAIIDGEQHIRYLLPFYVESGCLLCHAHQGYQVGDLRGGISVTLPLSEQLKTLNESILAAYLGAFILWLVGAVFVIYTGYRINLATRETIERERFQAIVENANDALIIHDLAGNIIDINSRAVELYGYSRDELLSMQLRELVSPNRRIKEKEIFEKLLGTGKTIFESLDITKNGQEINVEVSSRIVSKNKGGKVQSYVRDVSERKQTQAKLQELNEELRISVEESQRHAIEAEEANEAKSLFLANMSHEIRTPMNAVLGMSELLAEVIDDPEQLKYIEILMRNGENLLEIINEILDLSKIEAGKVELALQEVDICNLIQNIGSTYKVLAQKRGLELNVEINIPDEKKCSIIADASKIRQVLTNLIGNAIKYTDEGEVAVSIALNDNKSLRFTVRDSGVGISEEKLGEIFHAFERGDIKTSQSYSGTGLGLAISKRLIDIMGGDIGVESKPGAGSTFWFEIAWNPVLENVYLNDRKNDNQTAEPKEEPKEEQKEKNNNRDDANKNILLVDDNQDNRLLVKAYLKQSNYIIDEAVDGQRAVEMYQQNDYDLILMDMQMPIMDGYQATRTIRKLEQENNKSRVVIYALTAYADEDNVDKSCHAGCDGHIAKPVQKHTLLKKIAEALT